MYQANEALYGSHNGILGFGTGMIKSERKGGLSVGPTNLEPKAKIYMEPFYM